MALVVGSLSCEPRAPGQWLGGRVVGIAGVLETTSSKYPSLDFGDARGRRWCGNGLLCAPRELQPITVPQLPVEDVSPQSGALHLVRG